MICICVLFVLVCLNKKPQQSFKYYSWKKNICILKLCRQRRIERIRFVRKVACRSWSKTWIGAGHKLLGAIVVTATVTQNLPRKGNILFVVFNTWDLYLKKSFKITKSRVWYTFLNKQKLFMKMTISHFPERRWSCNWPHTRSNANV